MEMKNKYLDVDDALQGCEFVRICRQVSTFQKKRKYFLPIQPRYIGIQIITYHSKILQYLHRAQSLIFRAVK